MLKKAFSRKQAILFCLIVLIVYQNVLTNILPIIGFFDELLALTLFLVGCLQIIVGKKAIEVFDLLLLVFLFLWVFIGFCSYVLLEYQSLKVTIFGAFLQVKFFLLMLGVKWCLDYSSNKEEVIILFSNACVINMWVFVILNSFYLAFRHTLLLEAWDTCGKVVFLLAGGMITFDYSKKALLTIALGECLLLCTWKAKAIAAVMLFVLLYFWILKCGKRFNIFSTVLLGAILICIAWNKIYFYYILGKGTFARSVLTYVGIKIANDYFPLGTGFATFASYGAAEHYSPVYYIYGIANHSELGFMTQKYLCDTYWPSVLGETGWGGLILVFGLIFTIFERLELVYYYKRTVFFSGLYALFYLLITTFEETGFMQPVLMGLAMILGICVSLHKKYYIGDMERELSI